MSVSAVDATIGSTVEPAGVARAGRSLQRSRLRVVRTFAIQIGVLALAAVVWWWACERVWADNPILTEMGPGDTVSALRDLVEDGTAQEGATTSLRRLGLGLLVATGIGIPLGLIVGARRGIERASAPLVQFLRMMSPLAWAPVAVAVLGVGDSPVVFLVAVSTVWPIMLGTASGVRALDPGWLLVARSLGATTGEALRTVILPGVRSHVLTGMRLALGVGWVVLVPAEMLGVDSGLGYQVLDSRDQLAYDELAATMLLIGIIGFALDALVQRLFRVRTIG